MSIAVNPYLSTRYVNSSSEHPSSLCDPVPGSRMPLAAKKKTKKKKNEKKKGVANEKKLIEFVEVFVYTHIKDRTMFIEKNKLNVRNAIAMANWFNGLAKSGMTTRGFEAKFFGTIPDDIDDDAREAMVLSRSRQASAWKNALTQLMRRVLRAAEKAGSKFPVPASEYKLARMQSVRKTTIAVTIDAQGVKDAVAELKNAKNVF